MFVNDSVVCEIDNPKLISVNEQYMHPVRKTKRGHYTSYVCKSPSLKDLQAFYKEVLKDAITDEEVASLTRFVKEIPDCGIEFSMIVGLPRNQIYEHDISNFIKAIEDVVSTRTGINDNRNIRVIAEKQLVDQEDWVLQISMTPYILQGFVSVMPIDTSDQCKDFNEYLLHEENKDEKKDN